MPNIKSAKKRMRTNEKARLANRQVRSAMRSAIKRVRNAIATGDLEAAQTQLPVALGMISRSASKGIIHPKTAARTKSRLHVEFNKAQAAA